MQWRPGDCSKLNGVRFYGSIFLLLFVSYGNFIYPILAVSVAAGHEYTWRFFIEPKSVLGCLLVIFRSCFFTVLIEPVCRHTIKTQISNNVTNTAKNEIFDTFDVTSGQLW